MLTYENPIIPGFYPDPSVCRVGEDYYLVNSSFEFFPGVPLWHSRDLLHWEQIGHVLTRDSQLPLENCRTSGGIYAPTIRWRDGRFYMITTNVSNGGNFFVWTDDIRGEWSEPVYIDQGGIDPSLFWDDDGTVYYTGTHSDESGRPGIGMFPVDLETGKRLGETKIIWYGTGGKCPEGPHLYKINGWYYLMIAEGGTEYGHMETIARSRSVWGPYESCPHNPIVTHRNVQREVEFHAVGHADLVEAPDGKWWMVCHAIRPSIFMLHHTGRETMLLPVEWDENGWPVVNGNRYITAEMQVEGEGCVRVPRSWRDDFTDRVPAPRWAYLRNPDRSRYAFGDGLTLRGSEATLDDIGAPTFLGVRQQQFALRYETRMQLSSERASAAGLTIFHTNEHHYELLAHPAENGLSVQLRRRVVDMQTLSEPVFFENTDTLVLRIEAERTKYTFLAGPDAAHLQVIGTGSTQLLSTECMNCTFTGCFAGMFAEGNCTAHFDYFSTEDGRTEQNTGIPAKWRNAMDDKGFDRWADDYNQTVRTMEKAEAYPFAGYRQVLERIYELVRAGRGRSVLDVGFGTGVLTRRLYADGCKITGVDFSERMIEIAQAQMPEAVLLRHDFSQGLPAALEKERFDFIICTYALHHLDYAAQADFLHTLFRHLAPGGQVLVGDVAFATAQEQAACREKAGADWDAEEYYPVAEQLRPLFPDLRFEKISHCAGVFVFGGERKD